MRRAPFAVSAVAALGVVAAVAAPSSGAPRRDVPVFGTYHEPGATRGDGEPSIGVDWNTGAALYQSGLRTLKVTFSGSEATWQSVGGPLTSRVSLDPILTTDRATGRTWVSQLAVDCSLIAFTDDDGGSWQPSQGCGAAGGADHQTIGVGPYPAGTPLPHLYPNAVYYCSQAIADASCARSDDGGTTFGPSMPIYALTACGGLHGHVVVAPDGTVYVPNASCHGLAGAAVSFDAGLTWSVRTVDGSESVDESDPAIAVGAGGTTYLGWSSGDQVETHPMVSVSRNHGQTWSHPVDVGKAFGIHNVQFPSLVAGDDDRAAFAFLGSKTDGNDQYADFDGSWHLYVAYTYDAGAHWVTVDATPKELVQRGCIWLGGGSNPCRNLLDFMGVTADKQGRVLVGWADGCNAACEKTAAKNNHGDSAAISRQVSGKGLFAAYDGKI